MRLVMITDFTEQFSYKLLRGIMAWSRRQEQPWVVCKMPPSYKREIGIPRVVEWAKNWRADVVVGQFEPDEDVTLFRKNGIVAIAQDYITQFEEIPNLTGDYYLTGVMAARRLCGHGFKNLGFFGYDHPETAEELRVLGSLPGLHIEGAFMHFAVSDTPSEDAYTRLQHRRFLDTLSAADLRPEIVHCANSGAAIAYPEFAHDMVRPGIATYGLDPSGDLDVIFRKLTKGEAK